MKCLLHGIYSSFVLFFIPMGTIFNSVRSDGKEISDYQSFSLIVQTSLLWVVTMQVWTVVVGVRALDGEAVWKRGRECRKGESSIIELENGSG